jgi:hypothetical protein
VDSRPAKPHGHTAAELHHEWRDRVRVLGYDPERLIATALGWEGRDMSIDPQMAAVIVDQGLASLVEGQSTWRPAELIRELASAVPTSVAADSGQLASLLEHLAHEAAAERCVDISRPVPAAAPGRETGQ